jgi:hypothetical protein
MCRHASKPGKEGSSAGVNANSGRKGGESTTVEIGVVAWVAKKGEGTDFNGNVDGRCEYDTV